MQCVHFSPSTSVAVFHLFVHIVCARKTAYDDVFVSLVVSWTGAFDESITFSLVYVYLEQMWHHNNLDSWQVLHALITSISKELGSCC